MHLAVILMLVILDFVILTLKAEGSSDCLHHRHPEPFKGEGSSEVLDMKNNWMLRLRLSMTRVSRRIWRYTAVGL